MVGFVLKLIINFHIIILMLVLPIIFVIANSKMHEIVILLKALNGMVIEVGDQEKINN